MSDAELANDLRKRMEVLAGRYSQAEIARRTDSTPNNISRYLRGTRMPLEFGAALVKGLGVNPAWLLTGEGATWLADVTADTSRMAGNLLDLIKAMAAVSRMKLGELAGKRHLSVLRELDDALKTYEELRERLNRQTRPLFREFLTRHHMALGKGDLRAAEELRRPLEQVARVCNAEDLVGSLTAQIAWQKTLAGDILGSLPPLRETFKRSLLSEDRLTADMAGRTLAYASGCSRVGLLHEGRKAARLALGLADDAEPEAAALVSCGLAMQEIGLGDLDEGLKRVTSHITKIRWDERHRVINTFLRAMLLSGNLDFFVALQVSPELEVRAHQFVPFAVWFEDREALKIVCRDHIGEGFRVQPGSFEAEHARAVLAAMDGDRAAVDEFLTRHVAARREAEEALPGNFESHIARAQVLRLGGDRIAARKALPGAIQRLADMPPEYTPNVLSHAVHCRNVLTLVSEGARDGVLSAEHARVRRWLKQMTDAGYACLRPLMNLST